MTGSDSDPTIDIGEADPMGAGRPEPPVPRAPAGELPVVRFSLGQSWLLLSGYFVDCFWQRATLMVGQRAVQLVS